ncbi:hypothetical protein AG1IA_01466 [Rhizoctonia solani AG-1 IA]|uniref:Uncharacterized protein n=1 Tax=Thanatephorus cucumeris (strain AG1-IA) TaxID=983506 RepID=L8X790_THACA|nr:hypothetical protein AG1IA_01466 [Rhizoctonia solani AG-1 IA]
MKGAVVWPSCEHVRDSLLSSGRFSGSNSVGSSRLSQQVIISVEPALDRTLQAFAVESFTCDRLGTVGLSGKVYPRGIVGDWERIYSTYTCTTLWDRSSLAAENEVVAASVPFCALGCTVPFPITSVFINPTPLCPSSPSQHFVLFLYHSPISIHNEDFRWPALLSSCLLCALHYLFRHF